MSWLLLYCLVLFAIVFVWPTWRLWRRERINALVLPTTDTAEGVIGLWFKGLIAAVMVVAIALAVGAPPEVLGWLSWADQPFVAVAGWALLVASLVWMAVAQAQMGRSWRIGIDAERTTLVRAGLFARSRNPIFLGMRATLLGLFLVAPCAPTLAALLLGEALMQVQVRLEEAHLSHTVGAEYDAYRALVRRWL